jgi:murein DD-endopeptidase MepM/ murein hydrolase activator NlpD
VTALAAAGLLVGPLALPSAFSSAFADDLDDKKEKVEGQIDKAEEHLDHSSAELEAATAKLLQAREDLTAAQAYLAKTQGELAAAKALDREMQVRLDAAIERLNRAQLALDEGQAQFAEQEARLRQMVVAAYEQGDPALMGLSMVFTTQDPAQLTGQLNADDTVIDVETTILDQLEAGKVLLLVKEKELTEARAEVAEQRREAAANLRRMEELELLARQAKQDVAELVVARQQAMTEAVKAKNADLAIIDKLEAERDRIEALILQKATVTRYDGAVDGGGLLAMPVSGYVTSPFGWRTHPIWGYQSLHDGVDFGAGCGTPIRAAADGVVISEYYHSAWGNRIIIDHGVLKGVGVSTISNHLSGYAVSPGAKVVRGQIVGYVGTTGWSTGCHLHYTVNQNGAPVDPMGWF